MRTLSQNLELARCPHCAIANPNLFAVHRIDTNNHENSNPRCWVIYKCGGCGGIVTAWSLNLGSYAVEIFPAAITLDNDIPEKPRAYLEQAINSTHAPAGAVMLAASSVDAMLKIKGYVDGTLYSRIETAISNHIITPEMGQWAHEIRLDANDQRHADECVGLPTEADAKRIIDFAKALAEFLFVLPAKVQNGIRNKE